MSLVHHTCVDCSVKSPPTDSNYSLIGLAGWRLTPTQDGSAWRCPSCWTRFKQHARASTVRFYPKLDDLRRRREEMLAQARAAPPRSRRVDG